MSFDKSKMSSPQEKAQIVNLYHKTGSIVLAQRRFRRETGRQPPHRNLIRRWVKKLSETGSLNKEKSSGRPKRSLETVNAVRLAFVRSPKKSIRRCVAELDIPYSTVHKILRKDLKMRAYKIQVLHHLRQTDYARRMDAARDFFQRLETDPNFAPNLIFSDEATFHISGRINKHNCRIWGEHNPHEIFEHERDSPKVNVWCALSQDRIYGPFFFTENTVNGTSYLQMLQEFFVPQLPLNLLNRAFFQQDGAPPHYARIVQNFLNQTFPGRWIGRGGPLTWPPNSPDITPLDFFLWGYLKTIVYRTKPQNLEDLKQRIRDAVASVTPDMLRNTFEEFKRRIQLVITNNGGHVEKY